MNSPEGAADLAALRTQVTPENVMLLHDTLAAEALLIKTHIGQNLQSPVGEPGRDLVSPQAAKAFNAKIIKLRDELGKYATALEQMANAMAATAKSYGHTEDEIKASLDKFKGSYMQQATGSPVSSRPAQNLGGGN